MATKLWHSIAAGHACHKTTRQGGTLSQGHMSCPEPLRQMLSEVTYARHKPNFVSAARALLICPMRRLSGSKDRAIQGSAQQTIGPQAPITSASLLQQGHIWPDTRISPFAAMSSAYPWPADASPPVPPPSAFESATRKTRRAHNQLFGCNARADGEQS